MAPREWWNGLDRVAKTIRAAIALVLIGMTIGAVLLRGDVVENAEKIEVLQTEVEPLKRVPEQLDRILCHLGQERLEENERDWTTCER